MIRLQSRHQALHQANDFMPVFGHLSQYDLDRAYDQDVWAPNGAAIRARIFANSAEIGRRMPPSTRRYGPGDKQFLDIFAPAAARGAPVFVMIHGGAWRLAMREGYYGAAPAIVAAGCVLVVIGFNCLPAISMPQMAAQIRQALVWIGREIGEFGGDGRNLRLIGHSSGAHLAAVMLTTDWSGLGLAPESLRRATLISGMYELYPVVLSARGNYMGLAAEEVSALSPMRHLRDFAGVASVAWGTEESPEFQRQSQVFAGALEGMGRLTRSLVLPAHNHFDTLDALSDAGSPLMQSILADARD
jgi:arylformamidase